MLNTSAFTLQILKVLEEVKEFKNFSANYIQNPYNFSCVVCLYTARECYMNLLVNSVYWTLDKMRYLMSKIEHLTMMRKSLITGNLLVAALFGKSITGFIWGFEKNRKILKLPNNSCTFLHILFTRVKCPENKDSFRKCSVMFCALSP